jgi:membrane protein YdbS with pleckstrin-like domain
MDPSRDPDPFTPEGVVWTRVSEQLTTLRRLLLAGWLVAGVLLAALAVWIVEPPRPLAWLLGAAGVALAGFALGWRAVGRTVRAWGYTERDADLLVRRGVLFRELVVVPYGRMQFVDVQTGPLRRALGIATVQLHTAAAATDAHIPG